MPMDAGLVSVVLGVVAWGSLGAVGLMLAALARFYQQRARRRTQYEAIAAAAMGLLVGGIWDTWTGSGGWLPAAILALSGVLLGGTARHVFAMMLGGAD